MVRLGRYANWPRRELRDMTPAEFDAYAIAVSDMIKQENQAT